VLVAVAPLPAFFVPRTVDDPLLLVDPVEAFVEEASKLVAKRNTVAVIKAALAASLKCKCGGAGEDDQTKAGFHGGALPSSPTLFPHSRSHPSEDQQVFHFVLWSITWWDPLVCRSGNVNFTIRKF